MVGDHNGADRLARVWSWVTERVDGPGSPVSVQLLCETAVLRLEMSGAALTVNTSQGRSELRHATDVLGAKLVELQTTVGEGPGEEASHTGGPVLVSDLDAPAVQRRWPMFAPLAVEAGARALFTLPLRIGAIRSGTLVFHRVEAGELDRSTMADSLTFARLALRLLLDEQAGLTGANHYATDRLSLRNPQVHQATGMVAAQLGMDVESAFARLRGRAFADQRPLGELAADVVARRVRFDLTQEMT
jgi:hypothetical protein